MFNIKVLFLLYEKKTFGKKIVLNKNKFDNIQINFFLNLNKLYIFHLKLNLYIFLNN